MIAAASHSPARAVDRSWASSSSGSFAAAGNWTPSGIPTSADIVTLRRGAAAAYSVTFPGRVNFPLPVYEMNLLRVGDNHATLSDALGIGQAPGTVNVTNPTTAEDGRSVIIGHSDTDDAAVLTTSLANFNAAAATLGSARGSKGTLNVTGGNFNITGSSSTDDELIIGNYDRGEVYISGGGRLNVTGAGGNVVMAKRPGFDFYYGGSAKTSVSGAGSQFNISGSLDVGPNSPAELRVTGGAALSSGSATIRNGSLIVIEDAGSTWSTGELRIEDAEFIVQSQAQVTTGSATLIDGYIEATGAGTQWIVDNDLHLSNAGPISSRPAVYIFDGAQLVVGGRVVIDSSGELEVNTGSITGHVESSGGFRLSAPAGTFVIDGDFTSSGSAGASIDMLIYSRTEYSTLRVTGDMNLLGPIRINTQSVHQVGDSFDLLDWDGPATINVSLSFGQIHPLPPELKWDTSQFATTGVVSVRFTFQADFDLDADVDHVDLALWKGGFGVANATRLQGDANGDGASNGADFLIWQREFGRSASVAASLTIPEPEALTLMALASLAAPVLTAATSRRRI